MKLDLKVKNILTKVSMEDIWNQYQEHINKISLKNDSAEWCIRLSNWNSFSWAIWLTFESPLADLVYFHYLQNACSHILKHVQLKTKSKQPKNFLADHHKTWFSHSFWVVTASNNLRLDSAKTSFKPINTPPWTASQDITPKYHRFGICYNSLLSKDLSFQGIIVQTSFQTKNPR